LISSSLPVFAFVPFVDTCLQLLKG
jgi:hypothetical protein